MDQGLPAHGHMGVMVARTAPGNHPFDSIGQRDN